MKRLMWFVLLLLLSTVCWRLLGKTSVYAFQKSVYPESIS